MPKTMLIDATHVEETRVAVVDGNRLVEYDYESKVRKQLKGSIFLAKVTRVEPSLQAAFVNFGGNRHGFLPFSEIHPDYFRIPVADREALIAAQRAELEEHDEELEQEEAAIEQAADNSGALTEEAEDEEEEEDDLPAVVEVGGGDKPLSDDESEEESAEEDEEESDEDAAEEESSYRAPMAMDSAAPDMLRGPAVEDETDDAEEEGGEDSDADAEAESDAGPESELESGAAPQDRDRGRRGRGRGRERGFDRGRGRGRRGRFGGRGSDRDDHSVDTLGGDTADGDRPFRFNLKRNYKIQEVIKRGQIMLIQVSKEERGNKGAAVTTYLSMPGRYCVLMPNSPRGGGVSRKIASFAERKRMKEMLDELSVPDGMSVILRTAGVTRTKVEIKRDLDYLTRLWNTIREHTLKSVAPALIYEEGNLIKRAIRDLYTRDIEDVHVSGEEGYKNAKDFMKMLMPSHAKKVQEYKSDRVPMFHKFGVESQIADIGEPVVTLRSGGYLVINPTEALVSIDVNSGRATKERHIEETALKTNLEAADEVARQLRLRDLGGLVVIDFIDMEDRRNNRKVEQRLRDALSTDRARIQVGRISSFGLLELSRQRLNPSLAEAQQEICPHCSGTGRVKTLDFAAISIIRALEAEGVKNKGNDIILTLAPDVALYILNNKRGLLANIEARYGFSVAFKTDPSLSNSQYTMEASARSAAKAVESGVAIPTMEDGDEPEDSDEAAFEGEESEAMERDDQRGRGRRGRRGGRNRGRDRGDRPERGPRMAEAGDESGNRIEAEPDIEDDIGNRTEENGDDGDATPGNRFDDGQPRRRRGRRGGRGRGRDRDDRPDRSEREGRAPRHSEKGATQDDVLLLKEDHAPRTDAAVHAAPPIQVVARASNDTPPDSKEYEVVNQPPSSKKKGWWNKLVE